MDTKLIMGASADTECLGWFLFSSFASAFLLKVSQGRARPYFCRL
jgi:hypothetical protein